MSGTVSVVDGTVSVVKGAVAVVDAARLGCGEGDGVKTLSFSSSKTGGRTLLWFNHLATTRAYLSALVERELRSQGCPYPRETGVRLRGGSQVRTSHGGRTDSDWRVPSHAGLFGTGDAGALMVHNNGRSHVLRIPVSAEEAGRRLWLGGGGRLLSEAGSMDVPGLLVECLSSGSAFICDPRVPHGTFCIIIGILQLAEIVIDSLRGPTLTVAALESVKLDGDVLRLPAPITLWPDGMERTKELSGNQPWPRIRDRQFPIHGGPRCEQPYLFPQLDGVLLITVSPAGSLESSGELNLHSTVSAELVVF